MARLADIQAARLAGALLAGDVVKVDATFTLISRRKVRFWIGASATVAAIILVSWKVESHEVLLLHIVMLLSRSHLYSKQYTLFKKM